MDEVQGTSRLKGELTDLLAANGEAEVLVSRRTILNVLHRFTIGDIDADQLIDWASAVELEERLVYESQFEGLVATALFELASPEINAPVDLELARDLMQRLSE